MKPGARVGGTGHLLLGHDSLSNVWEAEERKIRRQILERLASSTMDLGPLVVAWLDDPRWFVQRNMLALLERTGRIPHKFSATPWTTHDHASVRHEAIGVQLLIPHERSHAIRLALEDGDLRLRRGLSALGSECPPECAAAVARCVVNKALPDEVRVMAIWTLSSSRDREAIDALRRVVDAGKTLLLRRQRIAPPTPVLLAALQALARARSTDPKVASLLAVAAASTNPDVREAARPRP